MSGTQDFPKGMLRKSQRKTESEKQRRTRLVRSSPVYFQNNIKLVSEMDFKTKGVQLLMQTQEKKCWAIEKVFN